MNRFLLWCLLLLGCATPHEISLSAWTVRHGEWLALTRGAALHSGERVRLLVQGTPPLYLYVVRIPTSAAARPIWLAEGILMPPSKEVYLPPPGTTLWVGGKPGVEEVRLLGSRRALAYSKVESMILRPLDNSERDPPPVIREKNRDPAAVHGQLQRDGTVLLRLRLWHDGAAVAR